jgi:hypothetical protein
VENSNYSLPKTRPADPARDVEPARAVLTLALAKPIYFEMAINLARSFLWWHRNSDIRFFMATDLTTKLPPDLSDVRTIRLDPGQFGAGFSSKLHLDKLAPARETLFVDADCLCVGNLDDVFERFRGCDVSVVGSEESEGELFGDIRRRCQAVGVPAVPRFCGGLYFVRKTQVSDAVFATARELEMRYEALGMIRLRGVPNEEPLISLGMAIHKQHPVSEDGTIKAEPMFFSGQTKIDIFEGKAQLFNRSGRAKPFPDWNIPDEAHPVIVHFNCEFAEQPPYTTEACRLRLVMRDHWPLLLATVYAQLTRALPFWVSQRFKDIFRPIYRYCFGVRAIRPSARLPESK